jgi:uncharacterized membrane protein YdjX (TVP38/TMEM64 family)
VTTQTQETVEAVVAKAWPWVLGAALLSALGFAWAFLPIADWLQRFSNWINDLGALGVVLFGVAYVLTVILLVPGSLMTFAAGVAYGWWALPLVLLTASIGSTLAFMISRYLLRDRIRDVIESRPKVKAVADTVDEQGWKVLLLMRTSPVVPFSAQNYLFGVTRISLPTYLAATAGGMVPGTVLNVYLGVIGGAVGTTEDAAGWGLLIAGLLATVAVLVLVGWKARQLLRDAGV